MAIPHFRAYLFDIDGTLLDSASDICGAVSTVLSKTERHDASFDYLKSYIGRHLVDLFSDLFPKATEAEVDGMVQEYRTVYPNRGHAETSMYPLVRETLGALPGLKSTATTKATSTAVNILSQFGLAQYFQHIQGTDGFPCKPAPDVLWHAMEALNVQPRDCLFIGDSVPDMIAGRAAGVAVCAVSYGYGRPEDLRRCDPDFWIDSLSELQPDVETDIWIGPSHLQPVESER